jgi:hypothetical protein
MFVAACSVEHRGRQGGITLWLLMWMVEIRFGDCYGSQLVWCDGSAAGISITFLIVEQPPQARIHDATNGNYIQQVILYSTYYNQTQDGAILQTRYILLSQ